MSKNKEVEVKKQTAMTVGDQLQAASQEVLNSDIIIPKLLLMQPLSDFVSEGKAKPGDLVRSTTNEVLGNAAKAVEFVPLKMTMDWTIQTKPPGSSRYQFVRTEPRTAKNENDPWEFVEGGVDHKRVKTINVYALLVDDAKRFQAEISKATEGEMPNLDNTLLPVVITFRSTSFTAGRGVANFYAQVRQMSDRGFPAKPYGYKLSLGCYSEKNDKGTYFVLKLGQAKALEPELLKEAKYWYDTTNNHAATLVVDENSDSETVPFNNQF